MGVCSFEVEIDAKDSLSAIKEATQSLMCDYAVVRAPIGRLDINELLMREGFYYAETMITLSYDLRPVEIPPQKRKINDALALELMSNDEFFYMLSRVKEGLFKTDRISLDPYFTSEQAASRYYYWLQYERKCGNKFYKLTYEGRYVGFQELRQLSQAEYRESFLCVFPEYAGRGFAMGFTTQTAKHLNAKGAQTLYTNVSSNNPVSLQSHLRYGYRVYSYSNTFIKHWVT